MQVRKDKLETGYYYHIYSRSISGYKIFNNPSDFERFIEIVKLYKQSEFEYKYSRFKTLDKSIRKKIITTLKSRNDNLAKIISYCIMPTHFHMILKQEKEKGISKFMSRVLNSYAKYFNAKHHRDGALWSGRFKNRLIQNDEQLLHLTRYIHLNPVSAGLIKNPEGWSYSSYNNFICDKQYKNSIIDINDLFDFTPKSYKYFVKDRASYQKGLSIIKSTLIDNYTG